MPIESKSGVTAMTYDELHGVGYLRHAREIASESLGSRDRQLRTIFQAVEVALLNLADLTTRVIGDLASGSISAAVVKSAWIGGFHRVLDCLSQIPLRLPRRATTASLRGSATISVQGLSAFPVYFNVARDLDAALVYHCNRTACLEAVLAERSLGDPLFRLLHDARVAMAIADCWERRLTGLLVESELSSIGVWIGEDEIREAVFNKQLDGDTFFTQFRGLHQIPEILAIEVNACLREALAALHARDRFQAATQLAAVNELAEGIGASMLPMVDCLVASDYHRIRKNLGLTSGSQSTALRKELFGENYSQLAREVRKLVFESGDGCYPGVPGASETADAAWATQALVDGLLRLRGQIERWRERHTLLPQHNLGGGQTKSLIGSPDAVEAVAHMKSRADERDPALDFLAERQQLLARNSGEFRAYLESPHSLNSQLMEATGRLTRKRFVDVQERRGFFMTECPFSMPPAEEGRPAQRTG
jgi:hypothetical protein